ncbi:flavin monoamine oxidase family protein [Candidatus Methylocalor cossyra]|uniref:NAD(P)-binding protein n=1 Tax=Candidatus Methylocalor cossyra TaxID=3108543 RepID=A0ABM9NIW8_9GAMM
MLDIAIVGGGLCGLALARELQRQGRDYRLFEARPRLGGRILTRLAGSGLPLDLGAGWFWPDSHPRLVRLIAELGLTSFPQHDQGRVVGLEEADGKLQDLGDAPVHNGALRLAGGMGALVEALAARLAPERLQLGWVLWAVEDRGAHVELHFRSGGEPAVVAARRVVLAMPPRLVHQQLRLEPPLDASVHRALAETPTWMAAEAKVLVSFPRPFWRAAGLSGNGFARHEQAVLGELFDACDAEGYRAALGGFAALSAQQRETFRLGLPMLIQSQLVQFFGVEAEPGEQYFHDWATEPYTCSALDLEPSHREPEYGHPLLGLAHWGGKLLFGGTETARQGGGYLEGALEAAARLQGQLAQAPVSPVNGEALARFGAWVGARRAAALAEYQRNLQRRLSLQQRAQLTQRALLETVEQVYRDSLRQLEELTLETAAVVEGRSDLTPAVLAPFLGFNDALLEEALRFNRSSCALSNFPSEHEVDPEYRHTIRRDLAAAWREFALAANTHLVGRAGLALASAAVAGHA